MTQIREKPVSRIPTFKTIEEEAEFWDTHSITDFLDELEEVTDVEFVKIRSTKRGTTALRKRVPLGTRVKGWLASRLRRREAHEH
ncbi:MAG: hypothetical protein EXR62_03570 [Chloroflexi bacterium]|nr:hypothetical protein [Chloroflexota bacterium]